MADIQFLPIEIAGIGFTQIISLVDGRFVGTVTLFVGRRDSEASVEKLFVHVGYRGMGLGRALVEKCVEIARAFECQSIEATIGSNNGRVIPFYENLGWHTTGRGAGHPELMKWML